MGLIGSVRGRSTIHALPLLFLLLSNPLSLLHRCFILCGGSWIMLWRYRSRLRRLDISGFVGCVCRMLPILGRCRCWIVVSVRDLWWWAFRRGLFVRGTRGRRSLIALPRPPWLFSWFGRTIVDWLRVSLSHLVGIFSLLVFDTLPFPLPFPFSFQPFPFSFPQVSFSLHQNFSLSFPLPLPVLSVPLGIAIRIVPFFICRPAVSRLSGRVCPRHIVHSPSKETLVVYRAGIFRQSWWRWGIETGGLTARSWWNRRIRNIGIGNSNWLASIFRASNALCV